MKGPTERKIKEILEVGLWFDELIWSRVADGIFVCSSTTQFDAEIILELKGSVNRKAGTYKWMLFFNGQRIFALDNHRRHHNPTCHWIEGLHFHSWCDEYQSEQNAEKVSFERDDLPEIGFHWFRRKLNIIVEYAPGEVPHFPEQRRFAR